VKGLDKASPALALLAVTNRVIPTATIFLSKLGDAPIDFFTAVRRTWSWARWNWSRWMAG
jgi:hypothetical protein